MRAGTTVEVMAYGQTVRGTVAEYQAPTRTAAAGRTVAVRLDSGFLRFYAPEDVTKIYVGRSWNAMVDHAPGVKDVDHSQEDDDHPEDEGEGGVDRSLREEDQPDAGE